MIVQLGAHVINAVLVYAIARRVLASPAAGLAAALVYASAPGHALAVRWIAFTTIWGTVLFYFLGLWAWVRAGERMRSRATLVPFLVALLCSEHAASFPLAVTALAVLGQGRRDWRKLARELAPVWIAGVLYVLVKVVYLSVVMPMSDPVSAELFSRAYRLSFSPRAFVETLGAYVAASLAPLYAPGRSMAWRSAAGVVTIVLTLAVTVAALSTRRTWLSVTACGLVLFVVGLGPVVFLPEHTYPAYIGVGALGVALAIVAPLAALPRGGAVALAVAAGMVAVHLRVTAKTIRTEQDFTVIEHMGWDAARWLATLQRAAGPGTLEVIVPGTPHTRRLFGSAHRMFLCAPYVVRTVTDIASERSTPQRLVLTRASGPIPSPAGGWHAIRRECPDR
jgi:hypothetical protein